MAVIRDKRGNVIWNRVELPRDLESLSTGTHVLSSSRAIDWMLRVPTITGGAAADDECAEVGTTEATKFTKPKS